MPKDKLKIKNQKLITDMSKLKQKLNKTQILLDISLGYIEKYKEKEQQAK